MTAKDRQTRYRQSLRDTGHRQALLWLRDGVFDRLNSLAEKEPKGTAVERLNAVLDRALSSLETPMPSVTRDESNTVTSHAPNGVARDDRQPSMFDLHDDPYVDAVPSNVAAGRLGYKSHNSLLSRLKDAGYPVGFTVTHASHTATFAGKRAGASGGKAQYLWKVEEIGQ